MPVTAEEIDAAQTEAGGWTAETLAGWGVPWPPPRGWRQALLAGRPVRAAGSPLNPICQHCAHWKPGHMPRLQADEWSGQCRHSPPDHSGWPRTHAQDWCGSYRGDDAGVTDVARQ